MPAHLFAVEDWAVLFREAGFANVEHERILDNSPTPETYRGKWFRDAAQMRAFKREGALLVHGRKPEPG